MSAFTFALLPGANDLPVGPFWHRELLTHVPWPLKHFLSMKGRKPGPVAVSE